MICYKPKMAFKVDIIPIGDESGIILPDAMMTSLGVAIGDELSVYELPDGSRELRRYKKAASDGAGSTQVG